jgi:hypothetical protein
MHEELPRGSRRAIRRAVELDCEIVSEHSDDPLFYRMADLSPFGMWIATPEPLRTGQLVVACFQPQPWQKELMVFAEVARVSTARRPRGQPGVGMGLELIDLADDEHRRLAEWLADKRAPVPRRRRPVPRNGWRVPVPERTQAFRPLLSAWR